MKERIKKWWSDFKTFDWKMYLALCLLFQQFTKQ